MRSTGCSGARFFCYQAQKPPENAFVLFAFLCFRKEITKKSNVGDWNHKQRRKQIESDNFYPFKILIYSY